MAYIGVIGTIRDKSSCPSDKARTDKVLRANRVWQIMGQIDWAVLAFGEFAFAGRPGDGAIPAGFGR